VGRNVEIVGFIHMAHSYSLSLSSFNNIGVGLTAERKININKYTSTIFSIPAGALILPAVTLTEWLVRVHFYHSSLLPLLVSWLIKEM